MRTALLRDAHTQRKRGVRFGERRARDLSREERELRLRVGARDGARGTRGDRDGLVVRVLLLVCCRLLDLGWRAGQGGGADGLIVIDLVGAERERGRWERLALETSARALVHLLVVPFARRALRLASRLRPLWGGIVLAAEWQRTGRTQ